MPNQNSKDKRNASMNIADFEAIREQQHYTHESYGKYSEHSEMFEDVCQEAEAEDHLVARSTKQPSRRSLSGSEDLDMPPPEIQTSNSVAIRVTYHVTNPLQTHIELEVHLQHLEEKHHLRRASFVHTL